MFVRSGVAAPQVGVESVSGPVFPAPPQCKDDGGEDKCAMCPVRANELRVLAQVRDEATPAGWEVTVRRSVGCETATSMVSVRQIANVALHEHTLALTHSGDCSGPRTETRWSVRLPLVGVVRFGGSVIRCCNNQVPKKDRQWLTSKA